MNNQTFVLPLTPRERRIIFREMIKAELEAGVLRYSKRRQLIHYAAKMGLAEFEAHLIIAQVQHGLDSLDAVGLRPDEQLGAGSQLRHRCAGAIRFWRTSRPFNLSPQATRRGERIVRNILLAAGAAVAVHWLTLNWLLG